MKIGATKNDVLRGKDNILSVYANTENVMARTRSERDSSKKNAIQVMEQATYVEKSMAVVEFLDHKLRTKYHGCTDEERRVHQSVKSGYCLLVASG